MDKDSDAADVFESVKELTVARKFSGCNRVPALPTMNSLCNTTVCFFLQPKAAISDQQWLGYLLAARRIWKDGRWYSFESLALHGSEQRLQREFHQFHGATLLRL